MALHRPERGWSPGSTGRSYELDHRTLPRGLRPPRRPPGGAACRAVVAGGLVALVASGCMAWRTGRRGRDPGPVGRRAAVQGKVFSFADSFFLTVLVGGVLALTIPVGRLYLAYS